MKKIICMLLGVLLTLGAVLPLGTAAASVESDYNGKIISVLGDSISTYDGYIPTDDGYNLEHLARYPQDNLFTGVEHTWWMQVITACGAKLGINDSWRGTTVDGKKSTDATAISNVQRIKNLGANGSPDVILFFGGTNDYGQLDNIDTFDSASIPSEADLTTIQWSSLSEAYVATIMRMQHFYPDAEIVAILPACTTSYYSTSKLNRGNALLASICEYFAIPYVDLRDSGITTSHLPDGIHPNKTGMDLITEAVMNVMLSELTVSAGATDTFSITHSLTDASASMGFYRAVRKGGSFTETLSTDMAGLAVSVTMGGVDITSRCYADGVLKIENATGDIVITASGTDTPAPEDHFDFAAGADTSGITLDSAGSSLTLSSGAMDVAALTALFENSDITVNAADGTALTEGKVGTGCTLTSAVSGFYKTITVIVIGDVNGDADVGSDDVLTVRDSIISGVPLEGAYASAADTNRDGALTSADVLLLSLDVKGS